MKHFSKLLPVATAVGIAVLLILLALHCVDIYYFHDATAVQSFTYEDVASRLKSLIPLIISCAVLTVLAMLFSSAKITDRHRKNISCQHQEDYAKASISKRHLLIIRTILFVIALGFILWGAFNGGLYDVLVKAINICTECIGLG